MYKSLYTVETVYYRSDWINPSSPLIYNIEETVP